MEARIDTSFNTVQRDFFASGLAAKIGTSAFVVWLAIKQHADFNTGQAWPGMRRLAELTGLSLGGVSNCVRGLVAARLLRIDVASRGKGRRGNTYMARERLDVRVGDRVLCTIVLDYVPARMRDRISEIDRGLKKGKSVAELFVECEVIPGEGFAWDSKSGTLKANVPARELPSSGVSDDELELPIMRRLKEVRENARARGK